MTNNIAIKVENLSKCYQIYDKPHQRLLQGFLGSKKQYYKEFWALKDISFELKKGETIGIIGRNGSGKSTLLQIICGTLTPTSGTVETYGRIAALLELGSGFNPEFTGRENVYMNASVLGLTTEETDARYADIIAFADIGDFIEQPVKTYSSGMMVRLAFAVIAHVNASILVVDEALAVGDAFFTQKCMRFLRNFMKTGTVLFVSHDTGAIVNLCNKAILLEHGESVEIGAPKDVIEHYLETLYELNQDVKGVKGDENKASGVQNQDEYRDMRDTLINSSSLRNDIEVFRFQENHSGFGTGNGKIVSVQLINVDGIPLSWIIGGEDVILEIKCFAHKDLISPIVGFQFKDRLGQVIFADNTYLAYQLNPLIVDKDNEFVTKFEFRLPVLPTGDYSITAALAEGTQDSHIQHHWLHEALMVRVHASSVCQGIVGIPMKAIYINVEL